MASSSKNEEEKKPTKPELLLLVFIHGFKGTDETFKEFPNRLQHILTETVDNMRVESIVFPAYETKGELNAAVTTFADWLTTLTVERENECGKGAGTVEIVLCGHSMGGLLAADSLLEFVKSRPDENCPLWPRIIACITFDTPFLGINPAVVKSGVTKVAEYANSATTVGSAILGSFAGGLGGQKVAQTQNITQSSSSGWSKWTPAAFAVGGALLAGAAAGGAYYKRDDLNQGYSWLMDHVKYAGNVWDEPGLRKRIDALVESQEKHGIVFQNYFVYLPQVLPVHMIPRTFIVQPKRTSREFKHFLAAKNGLAVDEVQGHTGMFNAKTNDGYYDLGLSTANVIRGAVQAATDHDVKRLKSKPNEGIEGNQ